MSIVMSAVQGLPDIRPDDDLPAFLGNALTDMGGMHEGDILCVAHKVVSKAEGNIIDLGTITPTETARQYAAELNMRAEKVEVILNESREVIRTDAPLGRGEGSMLCVHRLGFVLADAGVDVTNLGSEGAIVTLPKDPDASARVIGRALEARFGARIGVVITDTFDRAGRVGQVNKAIGLYRVPAKTSDIGGADAWGRPLYKTEPALSDELAAASGLVVAKAGRTPAVLFEGATWRADENASAQSLLRKA